MTNIKTIVVGIGTSAGGLEALEEFFSFVPQKTGIAFVVVQHLAPKHKGIMHELLQRVTKLPVTQIINNTHVVPDHVYIVPPNKDLSFSNAELHLSEPARSGGLRLPIDSFFVSLAKGLKKEAIGMVFSGMGSDGMVGLEAIKQSGGFTMAQSPATAKFESMPLSVINAGFADIVATATELAQNIVKYVGAKHIATPNAPSSIVFAHSPDALEKIFKLLQKQSGNDFSLYKESTVYRRIERRLALHQIESLALYADFLSENQQEANFLFREILIGVTHFFRDPDIWEHLINSILPEMLAKFPNGNAFRAWVPACSSGEEAYTLAIAFEECLASINTKAHYSIKIFATDLDDISINLARDGFYALDIENKLSPARLNKYFTREQNGYRITKVIREMIVFAKQNIINDPPFTKLDLLSCRNLMIYFNQELQRKIIPVMHYALRANGLLMLGAAESIGDFAYLFTKSGSCTYTRKNISDLNPMPDFPTRVFPAAFSTDKNTGAKQNMNDKIINLQSLADGVLLHDFAPAAVLITVDGDILYIHGRTGKYLEPAAGKANWNIYAMAREGVRYELDIAIKKAKTSQEIISIETSVAQNNGDEQHVQISVKAIEHRDTLRNTLMITFKDKAPEEKPRLKASTTKNKELLQALRHSKEQVRRMRDDMKVSQEELKAANEELQSANEELTTSKEEMYSLNEELQTVNSKLQSKVDDLTGVNNDMTNLLNSTEIATIFLDNKLNVRRFTTLSKPLFKLIPSDIGRPLSDIVTTLEYDTLQDDAKEVLRTLVFHERQVLSNNEKWFKARVMPYRTHQNMIDGVVITFTDISEYKLLETKFKNLETNYHGQ